MAAEATRQGAATSPHPLKPSNRASTAKRTPISSPAPRPAWTRPGRTRPGIKRPKQAGITMLGHGCHLVTWAEAGLSYISGNSVERQPLHAIRKETRNERDDVSRAAYG